MLPIFRLGFVAVGDARGYNLTMSRIAWATDIHLDSAFPVMVDEFVTAIRESKATGLILTGDIANGDCVTTWVCDLQNRLGIPIYFVLGNHDVWGRRIEDVHREVAKICDDDIRWLNTSGAIALAPATVLVGGDGWYDGRAGSYYTSGFKINDMSTIIDFRRIGADSAKALMERLADTTTNRVARLAREAAEKYANVVIATHVPPFIRACRNRGQSTSNDALPYYCNYRMGEVLVDVAYEYPGTKFTILAGHTHGRGEYSPVENLVCRVGGAEYMRPELQAVLEFD